jgi:hypothetical protein
MQSLTLIIVMLSKLLQVFFSQLSRPNSKAQLMLHCLIASDIYSQKVDQQNYLIPRMENFLFLSFFSLKQRQTKKKSIKLFLLFCLSVNEFDMARWKKKSERKITTTIDSLCERRKENYENDVEGRISLSPLASLGLLPLLTG